ncbi:MAG TPA: Rrf2 family transcriptional regulator [Treponema sp.]|nr:Rrf2 family transcriptional regulator [Treponema sp.]
MRITTRGRYALRASLALAELGKNGELVSIGSLAEAEDISSIFLEQIFFKLRKAGIVRSTRGPGGGFCFARPLDELSVKAILDAAGEDLTPSGCDKSSGECERFGNCVSHKVWADLNDVINNYLADISLSSLLEQR